MIGTVIPRPLPRPTPAPPPLPALPPAQATVPADRLELDVARLDRAGRCSARTLLNRLHWLSHQPIGIDVVDGTIVLGPGPPGRTLTNARGTLTVPAAARHLCAIAVGDQVLLAADLTHGRLTVYPPAMIARLLNEQHLPTGESRHDG